MKYWIAICLILFGTTSWSQHSHSGTEQQNAVVLLEGIGSYHRPVTTVSAEAQKYFDQGLTLVYGFNHEEAIRSFRKAAELDPGMVMAYWGIAYALGPNINLDVDPEREKAAYEAVQKAISLAGNAPQHERDYVQALSRRYSNDPKADLKKLAVDFKDAMGELTGKYPDDLDAAVLYAESMMNLRPWQLWTKDGKPAEGTEEILAVLESVMRRNPEHPGANHYYIHSVEASGHPERALPSAKRLENLVPAAGHLLHMPSHIYVRTGDYRSAAIANEEAIKSDESFLSLTKTQGVYPVMYYNHNIHFLYFAAGMEGNYATARKAGEQVTVNATPVAKQMPMIESFVPTSIFVHLRFRKWDEVMKIAEPEPGLPQTMAIWHFARGVANARMGKPDAAEKEQAAFLDAEKKIPADAMFGFNPYTNIQKLAEPLLAAEIAMAKKDPSAVALLESAVSAQDALNYDEPPDWYYPVRETLGAVLLRLGNATEAEKVFRADLDRNPRNGRSLFGLMESLKAQGKSIDASMVQTQYETAWKNADVVLKIEDL